MNVAQVDSRPLLRIRSAVGFLGRVVGPHMPCGMGKKPIFKWNVNTFEGIQAAIAMMWRWLSPPKRSQATKVLLRLREHHRKAAATAAAVLLVAAVAEAHPGRLGSDGCHAVRDPSGYIYRDGTLLLPGDRHCHRRLDQGMKVDGSERLRDEDEAHQPEPGEQDLNEAP